MPLSPQKVANAIDYVRQSNILSLPSQEEFEKWQSGLDGVTYFIEYSDSSKYSLKSYWTPSSMKQIPEAKIVVDFVEKLTDTLSLKRIYKNFESILPKKGCYTVDQAYAHCYVSSSLTIRYSGSAKMPFGLNINLYLPTSSRKRIWSTVGGHFSTDFKGHYQRAVGFAKWNTFLKSENLSDVISYNLSFRKLNVKETKKPYTLHQIDYGINLKYGFGIGTSLNYTKNEDRHLGVNFKFRKSFDKANLDLYANSTIIANQFNYEFSVWKGFTFRTRFPINGLSIALGYEKFMNYQDVLFSIKFRLK